MNTHTTIDARGSLCLDRDRAPVHGAAPGAAIHDETAIASLSGSRSWIRDSPTVSSWLRIAGMERRSPAMLDRFSWLSPTKNDRADGLGK